MTTQQLVQITREEAGQLLRTEPWKVRVEFGFNGISYKGWVVAVKGRHVTVDCEDPEGKRGRILWSLETCLSGKIFARG